MLNTSEENGEDEQSISQRDREENGEDEQSISQRDREENGEVPQYLHMLQGRDGRDGRDGPRGFRGCKGSKGTRGPRGYRGPRSGGVTYVRWGRTTCPDAEGTEVVYKGRAAGTQHSDRGGTNDNLCLPEEPEYIDGAVGPSASIHGIEYKTAGDQGLFLNHNVPCVVCSCSRRVSVLMIPARVSCPATWTLEYSGYLMTSQKEDFRQSAACVDRDPETVPGEAADTDGALFYHMQAACNGIECPPYNTGIGLTCAVCTK